VLKKAVEEWDRYIKAVRIHEKNHARILSAAYRKIKEIGDVN